VQPTGRHVLVAWHARLHVRRTSHTRSLGAWRPPQPCRTAP
jgi:hypothetical protein